MARASSKILLLALSLGAFIPAAQAAGAAAPGIVFHPAKAWTVAGGADGRACSIANEFNNGFTVKLEGTGQKVDTLSIDFIQNAFRAGESYDVNLRVPGVLERAVSGHAAKPNLLTVDMASEAPLYKALRDSAVMDIDIAGNSFRFYLSGFANAAGGFENCLSGGADAVKGAAATPAPPAPAPAAMPPAADLIAANTGAKPDIEQTPLTPPAADKNPPAADTAAAGEGWDPEGLLSGGKKDKKETMTFNDQKRFNEEKSQPTPDLNAQVNAPMPMPGADPSPSEMPPQTPGPGIPPKSPKPKITRQTTSFTADLTKNDTQDNPPPFNGDSYKPAAGSDPEMARKISDLEGIVAKLEQENLSLNNELKTTLSDTRQEQVSVSSENWNLEHATMRYNEAERQIQKLGDQIQSERTRCATEKKNLETMLFDPQVTSREQLARLNDLEQKLAAAQAQIRALQAGRGAP